MPNTQILYLEAEKRDFIGKFLLHNTAWFLRESDCKIDTVKRMHPDPPWIYVKHSLNMNCNFWHRILFEKIFEKTKVPIRCQSCWKVVFEPLTLRELMATYMMQKKLDYPSKCGTEGNRDNTEKLYGAYWYNNSYEEGLEKYEIVRKEMARQLTYEMTLFGVPIKEKIGKDFKDRLILKRACTEYEQNVGPSDEWGWDEDQKEIEDLAHDAFSQDIIYFKQTEYMIAHIILGWIHHACKWKDPSYIRYTNGNKLFRKLKTYHQDIVKEKPATEEVKNNGKKRTQQRAGRQPKLRKK
jgi:hypothetical protein